MKGLGPREATEQRESCSVWEGTWGTSGHEPHFSAPHVGTQNGNVEGLAQLQRSTVPRFLKLRRGQGAPLEGKGWQNFVNLSF